MDGARSMGLWTRGVLVTWPMEDIYIYATSKLGPHLLKLWLCIKNKETQQKSKLYIANSSLNLVLWNKVSQLFDFQQLILVADGAQIMNTSVVVLSLQRVPQLRSGRTIDTMISNRINVVLTKHRWNNFIVITILQSYTHTVPFK